MGNRGGTITTNQPWKRCGMSLRMDLLTSQNVAVVLTRTQKSSFSGDVKAALHRTVDGRGRDNWGRQGRGGEALKTLDINAALERTREGRGRRGVNRASIAPRIGSHSPIPESLNQ